MNTKPTPKTPVTCNRQLRLPEPFRTVPKHSEPFRTSEFFFLPRPPPLPKSKTLRLSLLDARARMPVFRLSGNPCHPRHPDYTASVRHTIITLRRSAVVRPDRGTRNP